MNIIRLCRSFRVARLVGILLLVSCQQQQKQQQESDLQRASAPSLTQSNSEFCSITAEQLSVQQQAALRHEHPQDEDLILVTKPGSPDLRYGASSSQPCPSSLVNNIIKQWTTASITPICNQQDTRISKDQQLLYRTEVAGMVLYLSSSYCDKYAPVRKI